MRGLSKVAFVLLALFAGRDFYAAGDPSEQPVNKEAHALIAKLKEGEVHVAALPGVVSAIYEAGNLKLCAAVPSLIALLALRDPAMEDDDGLKIKFIFPASGALAEIGDCALPALVEAIKSNPIDSAKSHLAGRTILSILREKPKAIALLKNAASKEETSPEGAQRLNYAAQVLESLTK